jgi:hypothetical protein
MYSHCIFCHSSLGTNEVVDHFPIGRRLAFDAARGRLWAVCLKCGQWNLSPLEARWEPVEECERAYRAAKRRVSTGEISLARVADGLDLVRIGKPLRPEFAAWRYADRLRQRFRRSWVAGGAAAGALLVVGLAFPFASGLAVLGPVYGLVHNQVMRLTDLWRAREFLTRTIETAGLGALQHPDQIVEIQLRPASDEQGWALQLSGLERPITFSGREALHFAHQLMPVANAGGATRRSVERAVAELEAVGEAERYFVHALAHARKTGQLYSPISSYQREVRLALEMAAHEEAERAALEGELAVLERAWRQAEEIAAIADDLLLPGGVRERLQKARAKEGSGSDVQRR